MKRIAIGAIMKDEAPYILEWVFYHKALGFELIIADNGGNDNTSQILYALHNSKTISRLDFRSFTKRPQIPAYRAMLRFAKKNGIEVIGFLDCDEFFTRHFLIKSLDPKDGAEYILNEFMDKNATQISYHTLLYGSRTELEDNSLPVLQRFSWHANYDNFWNNYVKSFIKVKEMFKPSNILFMGPKVFGVHTFADANKRWYIDNERISGEQYYKEISFDRGAVLHYKLKTWDEFKRKCKRGNAARSDNKNNRAYFKHNDINELRSEIDYEIIEKLKLGMLKLNNELNDHQENEPPGSIINSIKMRWMAIGLSNPPWKPLKKIMRYLNYYLIRVEKYLSKK